MTTYAFPEPVVLLEPVAPPVIPDPLSDLLFEHWEPGEGDWPHRARLETTPRTLSGTISNNPTNAVDRFHPPHGSKPQVDDASPIDIQMNTRPDWLQWIVNTNGYAAASKMFGGGYACFDGSNDKISELVPGNAYKLLSMQGNNYNVRHVEGRFAFIQAMDYAKAPPSNVTYYNSLLTIKQHLVGHFWDAEDNWHINFKCDPKWGDIYHPLVSNCKYSWLPGALAYETLAALELELLEPYPPLPFHAHMYGLPVIITKYAISGSTTWGYVNSSSELDTGWYELESMELTRDWSGRKINVTPWLVSSPVSMAGWTRQE